jgi:hypothetical protein
MIRASIIEYVFIKILLCLDSINIKKLNKVSSDATLMEMRGFDHLANSTCWLISVQHIFMA